MHLAWLQKMPQEDSLVSCQHNAIHGSSFHSESEVRNSKSCCQKYLQQFTNLPAICLKMPKKKSCSLPVLQWIHVYFGNITGVSVLEDLQLLSLGANLPVEVKNGWCTEVSYLWEGPGDRFPGVYPPQHSDTCWWRRYSSENGLESATLNQPQLPPPPKKKKKNNLLASVKPTSTTKIPLLTQNFRGTSMREIKVQEGPVAATARRKPLKHMASNGQGWWIGAAKRPVE